MSTLCLLHLLKFKPAFTLLYVVLHDTCNYPQFCVPIVFVYLLHKVCYVSRKYRYLFHWTLVSHEIKSTQFDSSCFDFFFYFYSFLFLLTTVHGTNSVMRMWWVYTQHMFINQMSPFNDNKWLDGITNSMDMSLSNL